MVTEETVGTRDIIYAWYVVFVLFLAYVVSFMDRQILSLLIEPIKQDLGVSDTVMGLLHGFAFAVFYTLMGIPIGRLADAHNRRNIIIIGVAFWSLMTSLCGLAKNVLILFSTRIGVGVGEATLLPSSHSMISDYFPRELRGRALSLFSLGVFAGAGIAFIFGGFVAAFAARAAATELPILGELQPWRLTLLMAGLPGILIVLLMLSIKEPPRRERMGAQVGTVSLREALAFLRMHFRIYTALIIGSAFLALAAYSLFAWTPAYFIRVYDYSPKEIGVTFGLILMAGGTLGLLVGSSLADLWYARGRLTAHIDVMASLSLLALPPAFLLIQAESASTALACLSFLVFFLAVHTGLTPAALHLVTPNELRGQITAVYMFAVNLIGLGLGPTIVALVTDSFFRDPAAVGRSLGLVICFSLIIGLIILLSGRNAYRKRQEES